jgi:hypothetical protein
MGIPELHLSAGQLAMLDVIGIVATVLAALLALGAVIQSGRQARKASEALRKERRLDFELDALRDLADELSHSSTVGGMGEQAKTLLRMLPSDGLQLTRDAFAMDGDERHRQLVQRTTPLPGSDIFSAELDGELVHDLVRAEVLAAIKVRVDSRD